METSLIYRSPLLYEALMLGLYGTGYRDRYQAIADLIPRGASVTDLCCGPATLYHRWLREKDVRYTGLDINEGFADRLNRHGATGLRWDMAEEKPLPKADYVIMQASLYHFLPNPEPVIERMRAAAEKWVIIAEPIRNVADSSIPALAWLARRMTNPGTGDQPNRFNEARFDALFAPYAERGLLESSHLIANGREKLAILLPA